MSLLCLGYIVQAGRPGCQRSCELAQVCPEFHRAKVSPCAALAACVLPVYRPVYRLVYRPQVSVTSAYSPEQGFRELAARELAWQAQQGVLAAVVDVRSPAEFAAGHIAGARSVPMEGLSAAVR